MHTKVQKWGNSLAVRIPKAFAQDAQLTKNSVVDVSFADGRIIIEPVSPKRWTLDELLEGVNDENIHQEVETGEAVGNEAW